MSNLNIIEKCKEVLMEYKEILFAYVFGSYVQGKIRLDSDIDIAIYLEDEIDLDRYLAIKMKLTEVCKREVDLVILNEATPLLKYEIYRNNIPIFSRNRDIETRYKVKLLFEYNDIKRYLDMAYQKNIERIRKEVNSDG